MEDRQQFCEDIAKKRELSGQATRALTVKILLGDKSPLRWWCKKCERLTEWEYSGCASLVGLTYNCKECGASTFNGMADYSRVEQYKGTIQKVGGKVDQKVDNLGVKIERDRNNLQYADGQSDPRWQEAPD